LIHSYYVLNLPAHFESSSLCFQSSILCF
jgi:hypothetical protein